MFSGKIVKVRDRGFGFIQPDGGTGDIYFHATGLKTRSEFDQLKVGDRVIYEVDASQDRPRAVNVQRPGDEVQ